LALCFKGARDYLQGGDLCEAIADLFIARMGSSPSRFKVACHAFLRTQPDALLFEAANAPPPDPDAKATFSCHAGDKRMHGFLHESGRTVDCRRPFDEPALWSSLEGDKDTLRVARPGRWPAAELMVSMTKKLHHDRFGTGGVRWIFTRLALDRWFRQGDAEGMCVRFRDDLHGRLTRSEIWVAKERLGSVFFSALKT